ncbi:M10 family metallopeptidase C-terminal domain-containing protein [Rhizobium sp. ARZ01]|uniref:M10 family metallopeptidase C-terminal domain-containing protein n=1 Tax=Rhizobium sp. ARZ01 TaxID=2769313 RepID=UPI001780251B|nr:M10 family metallopeptidase C-terminal domain-containing protein [Rhizobium sp. ARZ01]MBD9372255.1 M10 family metallopeptidase C-terminal domain-containing protein [Rhizobium sp. ARZ01]
MTGIGKKTKSISATGSDFIDSILSDTAWSGSVTYAFPTKSSQYSYSGEPKQGFGAASSNLKNAALFAIERSYGSAANDGFSVEGFTNLGFSQGSDSTATLRFAESTYDNPTAKAYFPGQYDEAGDLWFGTADAGEAGLDLRYPKAGNYAWHTLIHELGHALGLEHAHTGEGLATMPNEYDSLEYTVMTYHTFVGDTGNSYKYGDYDAPQTFMMADIYALQHMYGADYSTNSGGTTYKWDPGSGKTYVNGEVAISPGANRVFATIWDGGGNDTYDLSSYTNRVELDLRAGSYSMFSKAQLADLGGGPRDGYARGNIFNALLFKGDTRSLIENAKGGSGSDEIIGNEASNKLYGNGGNDKLYGQEGSDYLYGGSSADKLYGGIGTDTAMYSTATKGVTANLSNPSSNTNDAKGDTYSSIENLYGTKYADKLIGNSAANRLTGGAGNDKLHGGAGNDTLVGGSGYDDFVFKKGYGKDIVLDFTDGVDQIDLRSYGFSSVSSVLNKTTQVGADVQFKFASTDILVLKHIDVTDLNKGDFLLA